MTEDQMEYFTNMAIALVSIGQDEGFIIRSMVVSAGVWITWTCLESGNHGTADINKLVSQDYPDPVKGAIAFVEYLDRTVANSIAAEAY